MTPVPITIERLAPGAQGAAYDDYRRLRHTVFVAEQGWRGLASGEAAGLTRREPDDARSHFWLARDRRRSLVGIVRVCPVGDRFPHEELFVHHLAVPAFDAMRGRLGSLNSLAVASPWRRRPCLDAGGRRGTVAALLLARCVEDCAGAGLDALVATAQTLASLRALMRAGFHVIDPPVRTPLHAAYTMCNVGLVYQPADDPGCALAEYFRRCEQGVLGSLMESSHDTSPAIAR